MFLSRVLFLNSIPSRKIFLSVFICLKKCFLFGGRLRTDAEWRIVVMLRIDSELLVWRLIPNGLAHRVCLEWLTGVELQISSLSNLCK